MLERFPVRELRLHRLSVTNRVTGKSMGEHCEEMAKAWNIARDAQDRIALQSHQNAVTGQTKGFFDDLIAPVDGAVADTFPRGDTSLERLRRLNPVFDRTSGKGTITAGNASAVSDGAAGLLVMSADKAKALGKPPLARVVSMAAVGVAPSIMGYGPVPAVKRLFARTGKSWDDIDLVELNEAFAPQVLAVLKGWGWDERDRLNVNGSGISLGHPIGATGGRILATMLNEMKRRNVRYGLETMCIGGGQGIAAIFERA